MKKVAFDYNLISDRKCRAAARKAAERINELLVQSAVAVIAIGTEMIAVRAAMTPKMFAAWVETEFHWGYSASYNYMRAAEVFQKLPCLRQFQASALFLLCRKTVPSRLIAMAIQRAKAGEIITPTLVRKLFVKAGYVTKHGGAGQPRKSLTIDQTRKYVASLELTFESAKFSPIQRMAMATRLEAMAKKLRMALNATKPMTKRTGKAVRGTHV